MMQTTWRFTHGRMPVDRLWRTVLVLLCSLASEESLQATEPEKRAKAPLVQAPLPEIGGDPRPTLPAQNSAPGEPSGPLSPPTKKELEEIKAAVGINLFEGTLLEDQERLSNSSAATITDLAELDPIDVSAPSEDRLSPAETASLNTSASQIVRFRKAARHLEQAASSLEECGIYAEADRLRALAAGFWKKARTAAADTPSLGSN